MGEFLPENPVEIASPFAMNYTLSDRFVELGDGEKAVELVDSLDKLTDAMDMFGRYFVESSNAFLMPLEHDANEKTNFVKFDSLMFEGDLQNYSIVHIGKLALAGRGAVRAICMTFSEGTLLPFFDPIPRDKMLHVPVLAVDYMSRTD